MKKKIEVCFEAVALNFLYCQLLFSNFRIHAFSYIYQYMCIICVNMVSYTTSRKRKQKKIKKIRYFLVFVPIKFVSKRNIHSIDDIFDINTCAYITIYTNKEYLYISHSHSTRKLPANSFVLILVKQVKDEKGKPEKK